MAPRQKGKASKHGTERTGRSSWRLGEASLHGSTLILSMVKEAATFAPFGELKQAASVAIVILQTIQAVKDNKEAYERLGDDSAGLIVAIWRSYKKAEDPDEWLSAEMRQTLEELTHTLQNICSFVQEQLSRNRALRVIFSKADTAKIMEYRENLNYAIQKFELQSHMNINDVLMQLMSRTDQLSEQILHRNDEEGAKRILESAAREARDREEAEKIYEEELKKAKEISILEQLKQVEIDHQARDEQWRSGELKKLEKEMKDRQSELERLRAAASAMKKSQENEMAELRRKIERDSRESITTKAQSSKKKNSRRKDEVEEQMEEEEEWEENIIVEEATSEEEEEVRRLVKRSSKAKRNPSKSPNSRPVSTDDEDLRSLRSSKMGTARQKSRTSPHIEETEDESTEDEEEYAPPPLRKSPKVKRKPQSSTSSLPIDMGDLMAQFQGFTPSGRGSPYGNGPNSRSGSPMYFPSYGSPFPPAMGTYGYGVGVPGTIVNSGVGNITNTTISNVGNNNSVRTVNYAQVPRTRRRAPGN